MNKSKRRLLKQISLLPLVLSVIPLNKILAKQLTLATKIEKEIKAGNFKYIYANDQYRTEFFPFLVNVFHLYPEKEFHQAIFEATKMNDADAAIYQELQQKIKTIKPFLSEISYALPALNKQKKIISKQTVELLSGRKHIDGYLEIGSTGRYIDELEEHIKIKGKRYFIDRKAPSFSPFDIVDRGQINKAGTFIALNNYDLNITDHIPKNSLDLVTVYIGFHHCPPDLRKKFITSVRDVLKPNGKLIVRDHDAHNEKMNKIVSLAHDVFNLGTNEAWEYNQSEERYFYSLAFLEKMLTNYGFKFEGRKLLQDGDPTLNSLMLYSKA